MLPLYKIELWKKWKKQNKCVRDGRNTQQTTISSNNYMPAFTKKQEKFALKTGVAKPYLFYHKQDIAMT